MFNWSNHIQNFRRHIKISLKADFLLLLIQRNFPWTHATNYLKHETKYHERFLTFKHAWLWTLIKFTFKMLKLNFHASMKNFQFTLKMNFHFTQRQNMKFILDLCSAQKKFTNEMTSALSYRDFFKEETQVGERNENRRRNCVWIFWWYFGYFLIEYCFI